MDTARPNPALEVQRQRLCIMFLAALFIGLTAWSWRKWTDIQVDFGLQLYTPWQLAQGRVLYRDISYIAGGPLSQYFNAVLFKIFGPSYIVIACANLVIGWCVVWGVFRLFARAADWLTGVLIGTVTICVFVFGHLIKIGNYNFITPYTCETAHGFALSLLAIMCLDRWLKTNRANWLFAAGAATGCVFMTKPELFVALTGAIAMAAVMREMVLPDSWSMRGRNFIVFAGAALVPVAFATMCFAIAWPSREGLDAAAGAWLPLLGGKAGHGQFYAWCLGTDHPLENILQMAQYTAALVVIIAACALGSRFIRRQKVWCAVVIWCALAAFLFLPVNKLEWVQSGRALPPLALGGLALLVREWWHVRRKSESELFFLLLMWAVFAVLLLGKMFLNSRIWHYGFYLGLPAAALGLYALFHLLPPLLERFDVHRGWFRAAVAVFILCGVCRLLLISNVYYSAKTISAGQGSDRICTYPESIDPTGRGVDTAVRWLRAHTGERETLAVLPEGAVVNYLARRASPNQFVVINPHELQVAGEARVAAAFAAHPARWVLLTQRSAGEFGVANFGARNGYGGDILRTFNTDFSVVWTLGDTSFSTDKFGMKLLRLNRAVAATAP